jgi:hypothetical protein
MTTNRIAIALATAVGALCGAGPIAAEGKHPVVVEEIGMKELLRTLPRELEEFARRHPLPPPPRFGKEAWEGISRTDSASCGEDLASDEEWTDSSHHARDLAGTILGCAIVALGEHLTSRKRD